MYDNATRKANEEAEYNIRWLAQKAAHIKLSQEQARNSHKSIAPPSDEGGGVASVVIAIALGILAIFGSG